MRGGAYGSHSFKIFYNETPHNYSFGARTFFTGIGTDAAGLCRDLPAEEPGREVDPDRQHGPGALEPLRLCHPAQGVTARAVEVSLRSPFYFQARREAGGAHAAPSPWAPTAGSSRTSSAPRRPRSGTSWRCPSRSITRRMTATVEAGYRTRPVVLALTRPLELLRQRERDPELAQPVRDHGARRSRPTISRPTTTTGRSGRRASSGSRRTPRWRCASATPA